MSSATIAEAGPLGGFRRAFKGLRFRHGFAVVVALALLVRVVVVLANPHFVPKTDAADYDRIAVSLAQHNRFAPSVIVPSGGPSALRPPLFPIALAAVYKLVGVGSASTRWEGGRLFEAALGAITVALICLIALRLWGRAAALLSGAIAAVYPPLVQIGSSLMTESLFVPLVLAAVLAALTARGSPHRRRWEVLSGLFIGLESLTRTNGIVFLLPLVFLVWSVRPRLSWPSVASPLLVIAVTIVTLVPWTIRNQVTLHQLVPISTEGGYVLAGVYNRYTQGRTDFPALWIPPVLQQAQLLARHPHLNEARVADRLTTEGVDYAKGHPAYVLKVIYWNALRQLNLTGTRVELLEARYVSFPSWLASLSVYAFWVLGLLALAGAVLPAARRAPWAFWACPILVFLANLPFIGATRYRSPADPFVVMLAALALLAGWRRLSPRGAVPSATG